MTRWTQVAVLCDGIGPNDAGFTAHVHVSMLRSFHWRQCCVYGIPVVEVPAIAARLCLRLVCQQLISFLDSTEVLLSGWLLVDVGMVSAACVSNGTIVV